MVLASQTMFRRIYLNFITGYLIYFANSYLSTWNSISRQNSHISIISLLKNGDHSHLIQNKRRDFSVHVLTDRMYPRNSYEDHGSNLVLDDIEQIIDAIYIFKKIYNDLQISVKFEVPAEDPWPSSLHGLRLGRRLEKILSTREFFDNHPDYVEKMRKLDFEPNVRSLIDDWAMIYQALKVFKEVYGNLRVPSKFVVPDTAPWTRLSRNLKLGVRVAAIRSAGRYVKDHPYRKAELDELGFEWRLRDHTHKQQVGEELFDQVLNALKVYKEIVNEDLNVPLDFKVPDNHADWPVDIWGLKLGDMVQLIRNKDKLVYGHSDRETKLNDIGFPWEENKRTVFAKKRFELVFDALVIFKQLFGNLFVPQAFIIPQEDPWPEELWGLKLGARVNAIRAQGTLVTNSPERRERLSEIGFIWELPNHIKRRRKITALGEDGLPLPGAFVGDDGDFLDDFDDDDSYDPEDGAGTGDANGDSDDPSSIMTEDQIQARLKIWQQSRLKQLETQNLPLKDEKGNLPSLWLDASAKSQLKNEMSATAKTRQSRDMTFPGAIIEEPQHEAVIPAFFDLSRMFEPNSYREISSQAIREFMQERETSDDYLIREKAHFEGYQSPESFHYATIREIPERSVAKMKKIGYHILEFGAFNWSMVMEALKIYKQCFGNIDVPEDFCIDEAIVDSGIGFESRFQGLTLGEAVSSIRCGDIDGLEYPSRRAELDALGFDWGDKTKYQRYRFVPLILGLKIYRHLYGFPMPMTDYIVPDEPQWPFWMAGMPLGEWTAVARIQQKMMEEHYPHRRDMLHALEFLWWIPPGPLPKKYYKPVK